MSPITIRPLEWTVCYLQMLLISLLTHRHLHRCQLRQCLHFCNPRLPLITRARMLSASSHRNLYINTAICMRLREVTMLTRDISRRRISVASQNLIRGLLALVSIPIDWIDWLVDQLHVSPVHNAFLIFHPFQRGIRGAELHRCVLLPTSHALTVTAFSVSLFNIYIFTSMWPS